MKRISKIISIALCVLMAVPVLLFTACGNKELIYEGGTLKAGIVGVAYSASVATATGNKDIIYEAITYLPEGLELSEDGVLSGTPLETFSEESDGLIEIMASAEGSEDVFAEFKLEIGAGTFAYKASALDNASVGESYVASVATASGAANTVEYALKEGSTLPDGLYLSQKTGEITGTALVAVEVHQFVIVASAAGYTSIEVTFTITVEDNGGGVGIGNEILYNADRMNIDLGEYLVGETISEDFIANQIVYSAENNIETRYKVNLSGTAGLSPGLTLAQTGFLTGTPRDSTNGTLTFALRAVVVTINKNKTSTTTISGFEEIENSNYAAVTITISMKVLDVWLTTNRFETEHVNLTGKSGEGYSDSASGTGMIQMWPGTSGGASLGFMHSKDLVIDFNIDSSAAATASLSLRLASELGTVTFTDELFEISVNGTLIKYGSLTIIGSEEPMVVGAWQTFLISSSVQLQAGENRISVKVVNDPRNNFLTGNRVGGPEFDYLELGNSAATLKWRPKVYNTFGKV